MPRAKRAKPITLLLPSPSTPAPPPLFDPPTDNDTDQPSLEVLLLAREIAAAKGHVLDVDAFLPQKPYVPRAGPSTPPPYSAGEPSTPRPGYSFSPYGLPSPGSGWKKRPSSPALHWKTKKKLAMLAAREAEAAASAAAVSIAPVLSATPAIDTDVAEAGPSTPAVESALADSTAPLPTPPPASAGLKRKVDEVDRGEIQEGASYWNSLLIRARKDRGPQWDYNTQSYQVDRLSMRYYTHGLDPRSTPSPEPPQQSALPVPSPSPHPRLSDLPSHSSSPSKPAPSDLGMQRKQSMPGYPGGMLAETPTRRESLPPHAQQSPSSHISSHAFSPAPPPSQHQHHQQQQQTQGNTYRQPSQSPLPTPTTNGSANQMNMAGINPAMLQLQAQLARQNQASPQGQASNSLPQGKGLNPQQMVAMGMITPQQAAQLGQFGQQAGFAAMGGLPGMAGMGGMGGMQGMAGLPNMGGMGAMANMAGMNPNMMLSPHTQNQGQVQIQGRSPMMAQPQAWEINS